MGWGRAGRGSWSPEVLGPSLRCRLARAQRTGFSAWRGLLPLTALTSVPVPGGLSGAGSALLGVCQQAARQLASCPASEPRAGARAPACGGQAMAPAGRATCLKDALHLCAAQHSPGSQDTWVHVPVGLRPSGPEGCLFRSSRVSCGVIRCCAGAGRCSGRVSDAQRTLGQSEAPARAGESLELGAQGAEGTLGDRAGTGACRLPRNTETPHLRKQHNRDRCVTCFHVSLGEMWTVPSPPLCPRSRGWAESMLEGGQEALPAWLLALSCFPEHTWLRGPCPSCSDLWGRGPICTCHGPQGCVLPACMLSVLLSRGQ